MNAQSLRQALDEVDAVRRAGNYGDALQRIKALLQHAPLSSELLVRQGMLLQLVDDGGTLDDVETALRAANTCAPGNVDAHIELGHFLYAVRDRPGEAIEHFNAASNKAKAALKEALIGLIKCHADRRDWNNVDSVLTEAEHHFPNDLDLHSLRDEYVPD